MDVTLTSTGVPEVVALRVAREIAMDLHDLETILKTHNVSAKAWERLKCKPAFQSILREQVAAWQSAVNTHERVKLKSAALVEEWLPEGNARAHDPKETLSSKVELMKLLKSIAGMGLGSAGIEGGGAEKFSITINLGGDAKLSFEKQVTPQVIESNLIEGEVVEST